MKFSQLIFIQPQAERQQVQTLFGPCVGAEYRIPIASKAFVVVGPDIAVFAIGGDLPDGLVVWQAGCRDCWV